MYRDRDSLTKDSESGSLMPSMSVKGTSLHKNRGYEAVSWPLGAEEIKEPMFTQKSCTMGQFQKWWIKSAVWPHPQKHLAEGDIPILCILAGVRCEWRKILISIILSLEEITEVLNVSQNSDQSSSVIGIARKSHFSCAVLNLRLVSFTRAE